MNLSLLRDKLLDGVALGSCRVPGSKSVSNRALLLAASAPGVSRLQGGLEAEDTQWMRGALRQLGIPVREEGSFWVIEGGAVPWSAEPLWLGASGTTLRFLLPWLALRARAPIQLQGEARLFERPLSGLLEPLGTLGARWEPTSTGGTLHSAPGLLGHWEVRVDARASSQFLTGLALAAAASPLGGTLSFGEATSVSYLELTSHWLAHFGCQSRLEAGQWRIPGWQLGARNLWLPGDWSGAAAFLVAAAVTGRAIEATPLDAADPQGDRALLSLLAEAGCQVGWPQPDTVSVKGPLLRGLQANLEQCPDLGPVLAAAAALAPGPSILTGLHTLPLKECDRLEASAELVRWLGGRAEIEGDHTLRVWPGTPSPERPPFNPRNDHRMAFAAAVGGLRWGGELENPHCVAKTFPEFWTAWSAMLAGSKP